MNKCSTILFTLKNISFVFLPRRLLLNRIENPFFFLVFGIFNYFFGYLLISSTPWANNSPLNYNLVSLFPAATPSSDSRTLLSAGQDQTIPNTTKMEHQRTV